MNNGDKNDKPEIGLLILIILVILLLLFAQKSPEKEKLLRDKLEEKKKALEKIAVDIEEAKRFREQLLKDIKRFTVLIRCFVLGFWVALNIFMFLVLGYHFEIKQIMECVAVVNPALFTIIYIFFFLRYGKFIEIKTVYYELQLYILKLRYDKTEEQIEIYLTAKFDNKESLIKEIQEIETELKKIEESKKENNGDSYPEDNI